MLVVVAPGQGAQTSGFLSAWLESESNKEYLQWLSAVSGIALLDYGTQADAETIKATQLAQPLLVAGGLCAARSLFGDSDLENTIDLTAGHSVGELTASVLAGILTPEQAIVLATERGKLMADAAAATATAMTAVVGGNPQEVLAAIAAAGLTAANYNGIGQIVAAGTAAQLDVLAANPPAKARLIPLDVAGAFHTEHMQSAQPKLAILAKAIRAADPKITMLSNLDGNPVASGADFINRFVAQISQPVRWDRCMTAMAQAPVTGLLELAPAKTLTGLAKRNLAGVELFSLNSPQQLDEAKEFVARHSEKKNHSAAVSTSRQSIKIKARQATAYAKIRAVGAALPSQVIDNEYLCKYIDSSHEWITQRTGIFERRWIAEGEDIHSLALAAAQDAISNSGINSSEIDGLILSTVSYFKQTPALAPQLAAELGMHQAVAYDISAGCAGFCYGLAQAEALIRTGSVKRMLVIGADTLSTMTDLNDRGTAFLFSDGAGAAIVEGSSSNGIGPVVWGSDGTGADLIQQKTDWAAAVTAGSQPKIGMNGQVVYKWATSVVPQIAEQALAVAGITADELAVFIPHQANDRITEAMLRHLKLPEQVVVAHTIKKYGNNSSASIPIAIKELLATGQATSGQAALIIGFGAGLVYAGQVITLP